MNEFLLLNPTQPEELSAQEQYALTPCYNRCGGCSLFPYKQIERAGITRGESFRHFVVNQDSRKVSAQGVRLLCALTRRQNQMLPRDYLNKYAWPESTIVINNLNVAIYDLRIFLRGSSVKIVNHRKKGYCLTLDE